MKVKGWLKVSFKGELTVTKTKPKVTNGSVIYELDINIPEGWQQPVGTIKLDLPDPPDPLKSVIELRDDLKAGRPTKKS